ncbi:uncharacterized protein LOC134824552 [Bolinopsis microptera]|uniref:uncharacterized protein LOC134824552 n=1 Tax=Bolinopsis microptera TaxID=2820187 RepID=UPI0030792145
MSYFISAEDKPSEQDHHDEHSFVSLSDSDVSDIPSSKSSRPLSLVNPTSIQHLLSDYQKLANSLTMSSSGSSNFEISDYEGGCSSDSEARTPSPDRNDDVTDHDVTDHVTSRKRRCSHLQTLGERSGEETDDDDRSTTSSCGEERHEIALNPLNGSRSSTYLGRQFYHPDPSCFTYNQGNRGQICHYAPVASRNSQDLEEPLAPLSPSERVPHHSAPCRESVETLIPSSSSTNSVYRSTAQLERTSRMSYVSRALALARPTSPPPAYRSDSQPTVLTLRSYFNFAQVNSRPRSAPHSRYRQNYEPGGMVNEPYTLQPTHIIGHRSEPQHLGPSTSNLVMTQPLRFSNTTILSEPAPAPLHHNYTGSQNNSQNNSHNGSHSGVLLGNNSSSAEAFSPFTRRRNEDPYFGLHLLENNPESFCYRSNPEGLSHRSNTGLGDPHHLSNPGLGDPHHLSNPGSLPTHSTTPPCSYHNRRGPPSLWSHGYICHGFGDSLHSTPLPRLVVDTQVVNPEDALPPPYTEGDFTSLIQAPRYSEVVNTRYLTRDSFFHRNNAFACMGSVRTLAIGITLCCCGVVFLMVTYVFGAVSNPYLGYLGVLQVIVGLTMILLVAIYNSGRFDFMTLIKTHRFCPCSWRRDERESESERERVSMRQCQSSTEQWDQGTDNSQSQNQS